jgi:hypothetical protein
MPRISFKSWFAILCGFVIAVVLTSALICHYFSENHFLSPSPAEKQRWSSEIVASKSILVTRIEDAKTIVIGPNDKRFNEIIERTVDTVNGGSYHPVPLAPQCIVVFRSGGDSVVAVYTIKVIIIQGHTFGTPYPFLELFD